MRFAPNTFKPGVCVTALSAAVVISLGAASSAQAATQFLEDSIQDSTINGAHLLVKHTGGRLADEIAEAPEEHTANVSGDAYGEVAFDNRKGKLISGKLTTGYRLSCRVDTSAGIDVGVAGGAAGAAAGVLAFIFPAGGVAGAVGGAALVIAHIKPGYTTTVPVATRKLPKGSGGKFQLRYRETKVDVSGCSGKIVARPYTTLTADTSEDAPTTVTAYGKTVEFG